MSTAAERYHYRKSHGLCTVCGRPKGDTDRFQCDECRARLSKDRKYKCENRKKSGICPTCGVNKLQDGQRRCPECSQKAKEHRIKYGYDDKRVAEYTKTRRERLKAQGLCTTCGREKADGNTTTCRKCKQKAHDLRLARIRRKQKEVV